MANEISRNEALTKLSAEGEPYELTDGKVFERPCRVKSSKKCILTITHVHKLIRR